MSTQVVTEITGQDPTRTTNSLGIRAGNSGGSATNNGSSGDGDGGKGGLSTLEMVGIVIGSVVGIITTIATVWMCLCGHGGRKP